MTIVINAVLLAALLFAAFSGLYFWAALAVTRAGAQLPSLWRIDLLFREVAGDLVRSSKRFPTYSYRDIPWTTLRLNSERTTAEAVLRKCAVHRQFLRAHFWAYPPSQLEALELLQQRAIRFVELRDEVAAMQARKSRSSQEQAREKAAPRKAPVRSGWRAVLQLSPNEVSVMAIKAAYRKLAFKHHPDRGGSPSAMSLLNRAIAQARQELSFV